MEAQGEAGGGLEQPVELVWADSRETKEGN